MGDWQNDMVRRTTAKHEPRGDDHDAIGAGIYYIRAENSPALHVSVPAGNAVGTRSFRPHAATDQGEFHCLMIYKGKAGCYVFHKDGADPVINRSLDSDMVAAAFDRTARRLFWGGRDGAVVVCDLPEIRTRLNRIGLNW